MLCGVLVLDTVVILKKKEIEPCCPVVGGRGGYDCNPYHLQY